MLSENFKKTNEIVLEINNFLAKNIHGKYSFLDVAFAINKIYSFMIATLLTTGNSNLKLFKNMMNTSILYILDVHERHKLIDQEYIQFLKKLQLFIKDYKGENHDN